jgi:pyrroline-5-carboxylate reductase
MELIGKKLCIVGGGNLGVALARGIAEKGIIQKANITITRRKVQLLESLAVEGFKVSNSNAEAVSEADIVILCVQPKQLAAAIKEFSGSIKKEHIVISTMASTSIEMIEGQLSTPCLVMRAMPNTASAVGESMTCLAASSGHKDHLAIAEQLFEAIGDTMIIDESLMKAATVLGASGIAYFMRYLRAATQGGIQMGFHPEEAQRIAVQTAKGAATLVLEHQSHPEVEIDKVTTPMGCTIEGLNEMEHQGFSSALIKGLMTSYHKLFNI